MKEYTHDQILAVEEFAKGLTECFTSKAKDDPLTKAALNYALQVVEIHLSLAQLKFAVWSNNMAHMLGGKNGS